MLSARVSSRTRRQNLQRRLTARVCEAGQSIFFVSLLVHVLHNFQRDVNGLVNRGEYERQQRQKLHQIHGASPLCLPAPGRFAFQKSSFPRFTGSFRGMSGKWVQEHDHLQCRQHLYRLKRRYFYFSIFFNAAQPKAPPETSGLFALCRAFALRSVLLYFSVAAALTILCKTHK